jgi:hypothetical protein
VCHTSSSEPDTRWATKSYPPNVDDCLSCGGPRSGKPQSGCDRNDFHFSFPGQQPTEREYRAMVSRNTTGSDPLVQEPKK